MIALIIIGGAILVVFLILPLLGIAVRAPAYGWQWENLKFWWDPDDWVEAVACGLIVLLISGAIIGFAIFAQHKWGG